MPRGAEDAEVGELCKSAPPHPVRCPSTKPGKIQCSFPENFHTPPTEGIRISWGVEGSMRPKNLTKCMKLNWNFQRGGQVLEKMPSVRGMDIFWNYTIGGYLCSYKSNNQGKHCDYVIHA